MSTFWKEYPEITEELTDIKKIIKESIKSREKYLEESIYPMVDAGGKMLRPAFLLLSGKFGDYDSKKMHNLAAVIEMLHIATLIHDDIIDDSKLRRGVDTIQSKYGKEYAVYIGDFLFCQCITMLSKYDYTTENLREISKTISRICMSEISQYHLRYAKNMNIRKYIRIISGKTAALFAICFYAGAREANCNEAMQKLLGKIGYHIGMAFQIIDDLLDYRGDTRVLGKNALKDLKRGYYTLPLIYALKNDKEKEILKLLNRPSLVDNYVDEIIRLVKKYEGIERAEKVADRYTEKAIYYTEKLPDCNSKKILREVIPKLLKRSY
ncbi:polyprenyl synthetase family protein [Maledivibacter halophilus]|uniref:Heptaprenyl diphosphate synthase n=1 Tax=Maledivibacter halophilus TaxID=36842 RepID=A0A1T5IR05_9FIRM|nr:polyprenyl synthetase family protein [Maledivibacter halophilus]SKC41624.1 heptaprenyl diphosphate synthase [Maledivibacter halophilus]